MQGFQKRRNDDKCSGLNDEAKEHLNTSKDNVIRNSKDDHNKNVSHNRMEHTVNYLPRGSEKNERDQPNGNVTENSQKGVKFDRTDHNMQTHLHKHPNNFPSNYNSQGYNARAAHQPDASKHTQVATINYFPANNPYYLNQGFVHTSAAIAPQHAMYQVSMKTYTPEIVNTAYQHPSTQEYQYMNLAGYQPDNANQSQTNACYCPEPNTAQYNYTQAVCQTHTTCGNNENQCFTYSHITPHQVSSNMNLQGNCYDQTCATQSDQAQVPLYNANYMSNHRIATTHANPEQISQAQIYNYSHYAMNPQMQCVYNQPSIMLLKSFSIEIKRNTQAITENQIASTLEMIALSAIDYKNFINAEELNEQSNALLEKSDFLKAKHRLDRWRLDFYDINNIESNELIADTVEETCELTRPSDSGKEHQLTTTTVDSDLDKIESSVDTEKVSTIPTPKPTDDFKAASKSNNISVCSDSADGRISRDKSRFTEIRQHLEQNNTAVSNNNFKDVNKVKQSDEKLLNNKLNGKSETSNTIINSLLKGSDKKDDISNRQSQKTATNKVNILLKHDEKVKELSHNMLHTASTTSCPVPLFYDIDSVYGIRYNTFSDATYAVAKKAADTINNPVWKSRHDNSDDSKNHPDHSKDNKRSNRHSGTQGHKDQNKRFNNDIFSNMNDRNPVPWGTKGAARSSGNKTSTTPSQPQNVTYVERYEEIPIEEAPNIGIIERKVKAWLNKLNVNNFRVGAPKIAGFARLCKNETELTIVIKALFSKAIGEVMSLELYTDLAIVLRALLDPVPNEKGDEVTFSRILINECQLEFEDLMRQKWSEKELLETFGDDEKAAAEERTIRRQKVKGLMCFIGELFVNGVINSTCFRKILEKFFTDSFEATEFIDVKNIKPVKYNKLYLPTQSVLNHPIPLVHEHIVYAMLELLLCVGVNASAEKTSQLVAKVIDRLAIIRLTERYESFLLFRIEFLLDLYSSNWIMINNNVDEAKETYVAGAESDYPYKSWVKQLNTEYHTKQTKKTDKSHT